MGLLSRTYLDNEQEVMSPGISDTTFCLAFPFAASLLTECKLGPNAVKVWKRKVLIKFLLFEYSE